MFPATQLQSALIEIRQNDLARAAETARDHDDDAPATCNPYSVFVVGSQMRGWLGRQLRGGRSAQCGAA
jgi:hypothetical protein